MLDLNALRVFEKVATMKSFSGAGKLLGLPKSSVSRLISKLEINLATRLFHRTTREVVLTAAGEALFERCGEILLNLAKAIDYVGSFAAEPSGVLKISTDIGFGINILSEQLPGFLERYPKVDVALELDTRATDIVGEAVDIAIRLGPMPNSALVATKLGTIHRYLCAAPSYLARRGTPQTISALAGHDLLDKPGSDGRARPWTFTCGGEIFKLEAKPRVCVNEVLTIHRLVSNGAGIGVLSGYLCAPEIASGRLVHLLPQWKAPPVEVCIVFPSKRELAPAVRAFADYLKEVSLPGTLWREDPIAGREPSTS